MGFSVSYTYRCFKLLNWTKWCFSCNNKVLRDNSTKINQCQQVIHLFQVQLPHNVYKLFWFSQEQKKPDHAVVLSCIHVLHNKLSRPLNSNSSYSGMELEGICLNSETLRIRLFSELNLPTKSLPLQRLDCVQCTRQLFLTEMSANSQMYSDILNPSVSECMVIILPKKIF